MLGVGRLGVEKAEGLQATQQRWWSLPGFGSRALGFCIMTP